MSNENTSIHEFDLSLICEYYTAFHRQGPGSTESTLKALSFIDGLNEHSRIVDLGCGTGAPSLDLAKHTKAHITGLDMFQDFIDIFNANAEKAGLQNRLKGVTGSMDNLPFQKQSLDVIWSEGAIYNIGFKRGLKDWKPYLKPGGYLAVSEACWFTNERPQEIEDFWIPEYPEIDTIPVKIAQMQDAGYLPLAAFVLPETCWTDNFYSDQAAVQADFLKKHKGNSQAEEFAAYERHGAAMYDTYKDYYGYVFFVGQKL